MDAFLIAFAVVFVAELGDKTQLVALSLATRYRLWTVLGGITVAYAITNGLSVIVGGLLGAALPTRAISAVGALAFFGFAVWTLRSGDSENGDDDGDVRIAGRSAFFSIVIAMVLAELGDKTMLATVTLAADNGMVGTWLGSTVGMVAADALAIVVGQQLGARLPERVIKIGAAVTFFVFGVLLIIEGLR